VSPQVTDHNFHRLEDLIHAQAEENKQFRDTILNTLSLQQEQANAYVDNYDETYEDYPRDYQDYDEPEDVHFVTPQPRESGPLQDASVTLDGTNPVECDSSPCDAGFAAKYASEASGTPVDAEVALSLKFVLHNNLSSKAYNDMMERYDIPSNIPFLCVPSVNASLWDSLKPRTRSVDAKVQKVQDSLVKGIIAFTKDLVAPSDSFKDALTCLAHANFELNMLRRELIKPDLNARFVHLCKPAVKTTSHLFGDELSKHIKELNEVHKATESITRGRGRRFQPYSRGRGFNRSSRFLGHRRGGFSHQQFRGRGRGRGQQQSQLSQS
jgi:hypothetical protein